MAKIHKQRGAGQTGNTGWGHRSNRVNSIRRGGNPYAARGGGGKKGGCFGALIILAACSGASTITVAELATKYL